ncbi:PucR family transcriptional regulator [Georgenia sp. SYP-B2076]|uniref:PucR family transcriptional regulator n=1 Tax=Georgenia sp. SYP-B2076 TaxID=2495881 RepID=UPI0013DEB73A|nr:PucR family transcriptional regulator [Georgenia sp. SYP-B2076]
MGAVTVGEIMTLPVLSGAYVVAGERGLERPVTGVNVMEVPDIEAFVKRGEILLTTAYPVRERPERLVEMLPGLAARGLAALAIKPMRYLDRLPERLTAEADRLGFPVLIVPDHTSFNEVIGAVLAVVLAEYGAEPGGAEAIRERLTGVALSGGGLEEIARTLAGALARSVTIVDDEHAVLGRAVPQLRGGPDEPVEGARAPWEFPITVAGMRRGMILVEGKAEPTLGQRRLIRQSCFAAGMHIAQAMAGLELDRRLRVLFLEELVSGPHLDDSTLRQRSRLFGWHLAGDLVVLLARCDAELTDPEVAAAAERALPPGSLAWPRGHEVLAIAPAAPFRAAGTVSPDHPTAESRWHAALLHAGARRAALAVGPVADGPTEISQSYTGARETLRIAQGTGRDVVRHDALVLERLLLALPRPLLREFVDGELGPLAAHDRVTDSDLCGTLATYLGVGNGAEAARRLFVHYNTMKHRLARISDLTRADLHDPRTRLTLALALEVRRLLASSP